MTALMTGSMTGSMTASMPGTGKRKLTAARAVLVQGGLSTVMVLATDLSGLVLFNAILEWTWYFVPLPQCTFFYGNCKHVLIVDDCYWGVGITIHKAYTREVIWRIEFW